MYTLFFQDALEEVAINVIYDFVKFGTKELGRINLISELQYTPKDKIQLDLIFCQSRIDELSNSRLSEQDEARIMNRISFQGAILPYNIASFEHSLDQFCFAYSITREESKDYLKNAVIPLLDRAYNDNLPLIDNYVRFFYFALANFMDNLTRVNLADRRQPISHNNLVVYPYAESAQDLVIRHMPFQIPETGKVLEMYKQNLVRLKATL
jgi:hypothetical protein